MSSRLHNKWHRHNHHTNPTADVNLPDSGHDPIASPDSPFQGDFILNGSLSASGGGSFAGNPALRLTSDNTALVANGRVTLNNITDVNELRVNTIRVIPPSRSFSGEVSHSGRYLEINIDNQSYYIPLWKA